MTESSVPTDGQGPGDPRSDSPLAGKRVVITRSRAQAATLSAKLAALGAQPILFPTIELAPMDDYAPLDSALGRLNEFDWIVFTSANAVAVVWDRLRSVNRVNQLPPAVRFAAIGPATAHALERRGVRVAPTPDEYVAEALAASLGNVEGQRILLPQAELAREVLADELRRRGARVDEITAYRTLPTAPDAQGLPELQRGVDAITFTSASTARNFALLFGGRAQHTRDPHSEIGNLAMPALNQTLVACMGPVTAASARAAGLPVDVVAAEYTLDGLVAALAAYFSQTAPQRRTDG
jgi:uroporphyrinogen III methyltransferase/synthase